MAFGSIFTQTKAILASQFTSTLRKLFPEVALAYNRGFDARTIRRLADMVAAHRDEIEEAWNEHFA